MSAAASHPMPSPESGDPRQKARHSRVWQGIETCCFWLTMVVLAIATVCLAYLTVGHLPPPNPSELGWGATTPKWLVDFFPLSITAVCLGEAGHSFWKGMRSWKQILVGAGFLLLRGIPQWLPCLPLLPRR